MVEKAESHFIRLVEEAYDDAKKRKKLSVFINGKGGDIYDPKPSEEVKFLPLSKFTIHALELRPQTINLSIGDYKLIRDNVTSNVFSYTRITDYERTDL